MPFVGLLTFTPWEENLYGHVDHYLVLSYAIHLIIIFGIILLFLKKINPKIDFSYTPDISPKKVSSVLNKSLITLVILICIELFVFGAINIISGVTSRGDFRTTLGVFGFFYNAVTMFLPAGIIVLASIYYKLSDRRKKFKYKLLLIYILALSIGVFTGFKYTALLITSAGLVQMSNYIKIRQLVFIGSLFLGLMTFSAFYFMRMDDGAIALQYVFARATSVAVEGTVGVYNVFPEGGNDAWMNLLYAFGNKIASVLTGYSVTDPEFLKVNLTRYIGYMTYPKADEALSGAFNLTVTNFGEGVYYFGKYYYFIYSFITGTIVGYIIYKFFRTRHNDMIIFHTMINVYMMVVVFPWLMGGMIANLFGIPTIVYMIILYVVLKFIHAEIIIRNKS